MINKLTKIIDLVKEIDSKLGIKKLIIYTLYFLLLVSIANWKDILYNFEDLLNLKLENRHSELLKRRSDIEKELGDQLTSLRISVNADRVMLFEYHNTVSNLAGVPFRFMTMTQMKLGYNVTPIDHEKYVSINTGIISDFTGYLDRYSYVEARDINEFCYSFPTIGRLIKTDGSVHAAFVYLNGTTKPLGFIVIEWLNKESSPKWDEVNLEARKASQRINSSVLSGK